MPFGVEGNDLELERLTLVDDVARVGHSLMRELRDVDQAFQAVANAHEDILRRADLVVPSVHEEGIALLLEAYLHSLP